MTHGLSALSDSELAERIASGDRSAEAALVDRYSRGVRLLLRRLVSNPDIGEDLHQETFAVIFRRLRAKGLADPTKLSAFVRGIARNLVLNHRRRLHTQPARLTREAETALRGDSGAIQLSALIRREDGARVRLLLQELATDRDRLVLQRLFLDESTKDAICSELGLESRHFDRVVYRAKERFRKLVAQDAAARGSRDAQQEMLSR